jgi:hypothetical protein
MSFRPASTPNSKQNIKITEDIRRNVENDRLGNGNQDNIRTDLQQIYCGTVYWTELAEVQLLWPALYSVVLKLLALIREYLLKCIWGT